MTQEQQKSFIAGLQIGDRFKYLANGDEPTIYQVTDRGTRVIVAIIADTTQVSGPPYDVVEHVFDEYDQEGFDPC